MSSAEMYWTPWLTARLMLEGDVVGGFDVWNLLPGDEKSAQAQIPRWPET